MIQYNRLTGPFAGFEVPADAHLTLKIGERQWCDVQQEGGGCRGYVRFAGGSRAARGSGARYSAAAFAPARQLALALPSPQRWCHCPPAGHNNWKQPQDVKMQRAAAPPTVPQLTSAAAGAGTAAGTPPAVVARPVVEGERADGSVVVARMHARCCSAAPLLCAPACPALAVAPHIFRPACSVCSPPATPTPPIACPPACPPPPSSEGEWWEALVTVPIDACALNFVLTYFQHYDNNDRKDFKVGGVLGGGAPGGWWVGVCGVASGAAKPRGGMRGCQQAALLCACGVPRDQFMLPRLCVHGAAAAGACPPTSCTSPLPLRPRLQALIDLPAGVASVEAWADGMLPQVGGCVARESRLP